MAASSSMAEMVSPPPIYVLERMSQPKQIILEVGGEKEEDICLICLEPLKEDLFGHTTPQKVNHIFHRACIEAYLRLHADVPSCPYCRSSIQMIAEPLGTTTFSSTRTAVAAAAGLGAFVLGVPASILLPVAGLAALGRYYSFI